MPQRLTEGFREALRACVQTRCRLITCVGLLSLIAPCVHAAEQRFAIDSDRTVPRFLHVRGSHVLELGRFERTQGSISVDAQTESGRVELLIATDSVATGSGILNRVLTSHPFLDARHYAWMRFASTQVTFEHGSPISIEGMLTIKGVTRPIILSVSGFRKALDPASGKDTLIGTTSATIRRSDFGMGHYVPLIGDEIRLEITVEGSEQ